MTQAFFHLSQADVDVIVRALGELPAKFSMNTIRKIETQLADSGQVSVLKEACAKAGYGEDQGEADGDKFKSV